VEEKHNKLVALQPVTADDDVAKEDAEDSRVSMVFASDTDDSNTLLSGEESEEMKDGAEVEKGKKKGGYVIVTDKEVELEEIASLHRGGNEIKLIN